MCPADGTLPFLHLLQVARYLTPRMLQTAAANGIELIQIDWTRTLLEQGPFHVIIHKLRPNAGVFEQLRCNADIMALSSACQTGCKFSHLITVMLVSRDTARVVRWLSAGPL